MDDSQYERFAQIDANHWWFRARRTIAEAMLESLYPPGSPRLNILDIGTGSGGMTPVLTKFGALVATEPDEQMIKSTTARFSQVSPTTRFVHGGWEQLDLPARQFDLITAFDVLEHCADDRKALTTWKSWLKDGGRLLLTVPAFDCLWGINDELSHHYRRYNETSLRAALHDAGLAVEKLSYMNSLFFVPVWISRNIKDRIDRALAGGKTVQPWDFGSPPPLINGILEKLFAWESLVLPKWPLPIGTSLICVARLNAR